MINIIKQDILRGIDDIAEFIGEKTRRAYYLAEHGLIPAYKRGRTWEMRKSTYSIDIAEREAAAKKAAARHPHSRKQYKPLAATNKGKSKQHRYALTRR